MSENDGKTLSGIVADGSKLEVYKLLQLGIARQLEETESGRDMAALVKQFVDVTEKIEQIEKNQPDKERRTPLDNIKGKRAKKAPASRKPNAKD